MKLSRDAIQRMVEAGGGSGGGGGLSQSQIDAMLAGYAQRSWVDKNYLSIEFFSSIFRIHSTEAGGDNDLIEPNSQLPQDTSHVNIEAMFGFWTDLYISALGKSPTGQPASLFLSSMGDVSIPSPANGQVLTYDSASGKWVAVTPASGVDMSQVWAAMAAVDASKQIDISHLSNALSNFLNVKEGGTVEKPVTFQDTVDMGSTLAVTGAVTMGSTLAVTGDITMGSKLVATQDWANNTFVMKSWFDQIFQVFNDQTKIAVNGDMPQDKSKMNIQAMFGFWTELYVSALGKSPDGQASLFLSSLGDVSIPSPANGQVLTYDSASGKWVALTPASGVDMSQVWAAMAAVDASKQIDISHLSNALSNFLNVKEGGTVEKPVTFQDTVDMGSTLAVTGAVTMGSTLAVTGAVTMGSTLAVTGAVTMGSTLAVTGDITMGSKLVATQEWANNTFVMKSWFDQIFQVFNDQTKIAVNGDMPQDKSKMNIQAMFGFWTELYVSALGKSPDGQASLFLSSLGDVSIPSPANGQVLTYDSTSGKWVALTPASGTDMATVWANLAASDASKQIDISHLSNALSGYLPLTGGTMSNTNLVTNMNADLLDSRHAIDFMYWEGVGGGYSNMNDISRHFYSSNGMINLSNSSVDNSDMVGWTHFFSTSYLDGGAGNNSWCFQIACQAGTSNLQFRSLNGGTITDGSAWTTPWTKIIHAGNIASQSVNYANSANFANYVYCSSHIGSWRLSSDWDGSYFWLTAKYDSNSLPCATAYATSAGTASSANYATSAGTASSANYATSAGSADYATSAGYASSAGRLSGDSSYTAWGQSFWSYGTPNSISGNMSGVGDIQCTAGSRIHGNGGALYIGNANNKSWVQIADMCSQSGSSYWNIYANGSASFQSVYSTGAVSSLSDIRYKDIVRHFALNIEAIANASIIQFRWKESHDTETHIGGIAQEWQAILPDSVHETKDGKLAMDYGTIAYTSAVSLARKMVEQQKEIDDLKERLARLEALLTK